MAPKLHTRPRKHENVKRWGEGSGNEGLSSKEGGGNDGGIEHEKGWGEGLIS